MKLRKPLQVIALGAVLALMLWAMQGPPGGAGDRSEILVDEAEIAHQKARWERTWGRPPTASELKTAVDGYVRNEILYREALARGMDREDPRVRLALIQKMQMLAAGRADAQEVTEEDLAAFFALRKEQYRLPARISLTQVYFRDENDGRTRASEALAAYRVREPSAEELAGAGDPTMLAANHPSVTAADLEQSFGTDFTAEVLSLPEDEWSGPLRSSYGWHVVKVFERVPGRIPELAAVRSKVEADLRYEAANAAKEQGFQEIAGKYRVLISDPAQRALAGEEQ